jgi:hypothetical protein
VSADPEFLLYRIPDTTIDGPAHDHGAEIALKVMATVHVDRLSDGMGGTADIRTLKVKDWGGPWAEAHDPGADGPDALRDVKLCGRCRAGEGGECHTPGCALWMNRAPDVPVQGGGA